MDAKQVAHVCERIISFFPRIHHETDPFRVLISTIISHNDIHLAQMRKLAELCREKGIRDQVVLVAGGTQVNREMAAETGLDATFGRGTKGIHVVNAIVKTLTQRGVV